MIGQVVGKGRAELVVGQGRAELVVGLVVGQDREVAVKIENEYREKV